MVRGWRSLYGPTKKEPVRQRHQHRLVDVVAVVVAADESNDITQKIFQFTLLGLLYTSRLFFTQLLQ
jgi:hypothetical protein